MFSIRQYTNSQTLGDDQPRSKPPPRVRIHVHVLTRWLPLCRPVALPRSRVTNWWRWAARCARCCWCAVRSWCATGSTGCTRSGAAWWAPRWWTGCCSSPTACAVGSRPLRSGRSCSSRESSHTVRTLTRTLISHGESADSDTHLTR